MRKRNLFLITITVLFSVLLMSGCSSSTMIRSNPSGAKVFINGEQVGRTPYLHVDNRISFMSFNVDIIKEGYEPIYTSIYRDGEFNVGNFVGGLFVWPILLWTMDYTPTHTYDLRPISNNDLSQPSNDPINNNIVSPLRPKAERLKELKQLYDDKLITEKDFESKKQKILEEN